MEWFFVQLEAFHKLGREMRKGVGYRAVDSGSSDYRANNLYCLWGQMKSILMKGGLNLSWTHYPDEPQGRHVFIFTCTSDGGVISEYKTNKESPNSESANFSIKVLRVIFCFVGYLISVATT